MIMSLLKKKNMPNIVFIIVIGLANLANLANLIRLFRLMAIKDLSTRFIIIISKFYGANLETFWS